MKTSHLLSADPRNQTIIRAVKWKYFKIVDIDPCLSEHHSIIDDYRRSTKYRPRVSERRLCDNNLTPGWYRLKINGTDADIPNKCVKVKQSDMYSINEPNILMYIGLLKKPFECQSIKLILELYPNGNLLVKTIWIVSTWLWLIYHCLQRIAETISIVDAIFIKLHTL